MDRKEIILNGNNFSDLNGFYDEVDKVLTKDLDWQTGRNLDAFNDLLRGGFGVHEYWEPIKIIWYNSSKSRTDFGFDATIKYLNKKLTICHPTNISFVEAELEEAKKQRGQTLFDIMVGIIKNHEHIVLELK